MHITGNDGYQNFPVFAPMLSSQILDSNKKLLTGYWLECNRKNYTIWYNLELTVSNLSIGKVIFKFNNSVLMQKKCFFIV